GQEEGQAQGQAQGQAEIHQAQGFQEEGCHAAAGSKEGCSPAYQEVAGTSGLAPAPDVEGLGFRRRGCALFEIAEMAPA
ncbi:MAG: hypothetical protein KAR22_27870, partial [Gammaproteobacteria bacterium]|nr:hypothetical protein [Gammaproteobacteria bacterium]